MNILNFIKIDNKEKITQIYDHYNFNTNSENDQMLFSIFILNEEKISETDPKLVKTIKCRFQFLY